MEIFCFFMLFGDERFVGTEKNLSKLHQYLIHDNILPSSKLLFTIAKEFQFIFAFPCNTFFD